MIVSSPLLFPWSILDHLDDWLEISEGWKGREMSDVRNVNLQVINLK